LRGREVGAVTVQALMPVFLGPLIGSFVLVVVLRYPWLQGVALGRSACPACHFPIAARDLVPIVSWICLRGRCRSCAAPIGWHYPAVEIAAAVIAWSAVVAFSGWLVWASCLLGWALLALSLIDLRCYLLPDLLTLPMLLAGLAVSAWISLSSLPDHLLGAILGYAALAGVARLYRALRGRDGMGLGDAKLLAAAGAWLSWQALPEVVLIAAILALAFAVASSLRRRMQLSATTRVPFGPCLSMAIWLVWLYGPPDLWLRSV
jgi:leader peptidase (prepilin peptidase) / N-methyltransferase